MRTLEIGTTFGFESKRGGIEVLEFLDRGDTAKDKSENDVFGKRKQVGGDGGRAVSEMIHVGEAGFAFDERRDIKGKHFVIEILGAS